MNLKLKVTDTEQQSIADSVACFHSSLAKAVADGNALVDKLENSFLAVDEKTVAELRRESNSVDAAIWNLGIALYRMRENFDERIVNGQANQYESENN